MKYIYQSEGAGSLGKGLIKRWVGCLLGLALFLSAAGSVALANSSALTHQQYIQWMASICGDRLPSSSSGQDLINWARGKGMNPAGGWQLNARLTREAAAQTIVQLLNLAPRKGTFDAVRILEREGIILGSSGGFITIKILVRLIDDGFVGRCRPNHGNGNGNGNGRDDDDGHNGGGNHGDDDDDDGGRGDDDDGPKPTPTKPGHGHGDDNHDHHGPPGHGGPKPGHGHGHGRGGHK